MLAVWGNETSNLLTYRFVSMARSSRVRGIRLWAVKTLRAVGTHELLLPRHISQTSRTSWYSSSKRVAFTKVITKKRKRVLSSSLPLRSPRCVLYKSMVTICLP